MDGLITEVIDRAVDRGVSEAQTHYGLEKPLVPLMMDRALSGLGWTMDGLRQALLFCNLSDKRLTDVKLLEKYRYLQVVDLSRNHIQSFRAALALVDLIKADVSHNLLTELDFDNSTRLKTLDVGWNKLESLESLGTLPSLHILNLEHNLLTSAEGLVGCRALQVLNLSHNNISSLEALASLPHLKELRATHNALRSLDGLEKLPALTVLEAAHNEICDTRALQHLTHLQRLDLSNNNLVDQGCIRYCKDLKYLVDVTFRKNPFESAREYRLSIIFRLNGLTRLDGKPVTPDEKSAAENLCNPSPRVTAALDHALHLSRRIFVPSRVEHTTLAAPNRGYPMLVVTGPDWEEALAARKRHAGRHGSIALVDLTTTALDIPGTTRVGDNEFTMLADDGCLFMAYELGTERYGLEVSAVEEAAAEGKLPAICMHERGVHAMNFPGFDVLVLVTDPRTTERLTAGYLPPVELMDAESVDADHAVTWATDQLAKDPTIMLTRQKS